MGATKPESPWIPQEQPTGRWLIKCDRADDQSPGLIASNLHEARAKQIAREHNSHDSLVEACEELILALGKTEGARRSDAEHHEAMRVYELARAALADARKGE